MPESEVFHSPALYLGPLEVSERPSPRKGRLRAAVAKRWVTRLLLMAHHLPTVPRRGVGGLLTLPVHLAAAVPGNQLLASCRILSALAARAGYRHPPRRMYREFVDGARNVLHWGSPALCGRPDESAAHIDVLRPERIQGLLDQHGGCILCVPHCTGAVFTALQVSRLFPTVLLAKNPKSIERTRTALRIYESLGVRVLLVRDGNPFELTRACLRLLREGHLLVATVDRIHREADRVLVPFLGGVASLGPWPSRLAAKAQVPVLPGYVHTRRHGVVLDTGAPLVSTHPDALLGHFMRYIEQKVVQDPMSWSFLGDRRWRWVLEDALAGSRRTDGGVLRPTRSGKPLHPSRDLDECVPPMESTVTGRRSALLGG